MTLVQSLMLVLVALGGAGVVLTREPSRQALVASFYGLLLAITFVTFQAPDVALSELAVGPPTPLPSWTPAPRPITATRRRSGSSRAASSGA